MRPRQPAGAAAPYAAKELDTEAGDVLTVLSELNRWYRARNARGEEGWVPAETTREV